MCHVYVMLTSSKMVWKIESKAEVLFFMPCHGAEEMFLGWRRMCELSKDSGSCQEDEGPQG
jgi:hypothetical protein